MYELEQVMSLLCFVTGSACLGYDSKFMLCACNGFGRYGEGFTSGKLQA